MERPARDFRRVWLARGLAMAADLLEIVVFPVFAPGIASPVADAVDLAMAGLLTALLGWHWAFLPSFVAEVVPGSPAEVAGILPGDCFTAIDGVIKQIVEAVRNVLERIPPEVAGDIHDVGLVITGGMALLAGMDKRLSQATKLHITIAESPRESVGRGLILLYENPLMLRRVARNIELS